MSLQISGHSVSRDINLNVSTVNTQAPILSEPVAKQAYDLVMKMVSNKTITQINIVEIVGIAIQVVQTQKKGSTPLTNDEKKTLVMSIISKLVEELPGIDPDVKIYLTQIFIPVMLSGLIDSLCNLNINDIKDGIKSCFPCCSSK